MFFYKIEKLNSKSLACNYDYLYFANQKAADNIHTQIKAANYGLRYKILTIFCTHYIYKYYNKAINYNFKNIT